MACTIRQVAPPEIVFRWREVEPVLRQATDRTAGTYEPIDVLLLALQNAVGFWLIEDGADLVAVVVAEIRNFPRKRALDIPFVAGERMDEWWSIFVETMDAFAKAQGCHAITSICAREGWLGFWKRHGVSARFAGVAIVRDL